MLLPPDASAILATGFPPTSTLAAFVATSVAGTEPKVHIRFAPLVTNKLILSSPFILGYAAIRPLIQHDSLQLVEIDQFASDFIPYLIPHQML